MRLSTQNTTVTVLGDGAATPAFGASAAYPTPGYARFCVFQGAQNCTLSATGANPVHSFGAAKGSAYNKNWKFAA